jgi:hypothetical protein
MWFKRFIISSIPVVAFSIYLGMFPWLLAFFYYLNIWIILWSKDNSGSHRGGGDPDQLGGPY